MPMPRPTRCGPFALATTLIALSAACLGGCGWVQRIGRSFAGGIDITTAEGARLWQRFDRVAFARRDYGMVDITLARQADSSDPRLGQVTQTLWIHQQWRHEPGSSSMDVSSTNCTIRYRLSTAGGWREYEGAGAVHATDGFRDTLNVELRNATLRSADSGGSLADILGAAILSGRTKAVHDDAAVAEAIAVFRSRASTPAP